jgi:oxygen-dependent protoporphyrinogen oxidase
MERTSGQLLTLEGGFTDLIDAIHENLGDAFRGDTAPDAIVRDDGKWVLLKNGVELTRSRQLVMALHAREAMQLLHEAPGTETERVAFQQARAAAEGISNAPLAVVTTAHRAEDVRGAIDGFGFIALRNKSFRPLGVQFASSIFPSQSPSGHVQLRTLLGCVSDPEAVELDDPQLLDAALAPVQDVLHIENTPSHTWIQRVREGIPQYNIGHIGRVHAMERFAETMPSLFFVGDSLHGVGINKVVAKAHEVALILLSHRGQSEADCPR